MISNHYARVFFEAIGNTTVIPLSSEATFAAMKSFGGFDLAPAFALAVAGALIGHGFNWLVGRMVLILLNRKGKVQASNAHYQHGQRLFNHYGLFLLLFCWLPLGNLFVLLAGFFRVKLTWTLALVFIGELGYYASYLL